jgi:hypothetical protein
MIKYQQQQLLLFHFQPFFDKNNHKLDRVFLDIEVLLKKFS